MKRNLTLLFLLTLIVSSCTKEVKIDIPGYEEKLVIDGQIEPGSPPFVILSTTKNIYSPTDLQAYINSFISGAIITVSNGSKTVILDEICSDNLPPGSEDLVSQLFGIPVENLIGVKICAYTTLDTDIWGEVGKTYTLKVEHNGAEYTSSTTLKTPVGFSKTFWKAEAKYPEYGFGWATLSDPAPDYNAYLMEVKRINLDVNGNERDPLFTALFNPAFNDEFVNGTTFDFAYDNPMTYGDNSVPNAVKGWYKIGDTVVTRLSQVDPLAYEFLEKKYVQINSAGNPFGVPTNIPTNIKGGALGAWIGYSPAYDTLIVKQ
jgi:hypothetical protein